MSSGKRFAKNTGIYFIGSFATKILQFLLIPLYSKFISTEDLGVYNLITVTVTLALPILFQSIWEGAFRFAIEKQDNPRYVLSSSSKYCLSLTLIYSALFIGISYIVDLQFAWLILFFGVSQVLASYWQFSARALKENTIYATSSVINTLISISLNFILIMKFNQGINSLLIANSVGTFVMILILEHRLSILKDIKKYPIDKALLKNILKYSLPLAINSISWWMFSSCNNYVVTGMLGNSENGIYGMALRFGTILSTITSVVTLAWNEEAFRTYNDDDRDAYFNKVLSLLVKSLFSICLIIIPLSYIIYHFFVFGDFNKGVYLVGPIYLGAVINTLSCHLGSALLARKESNVLFVTTMLGGLISIVTSFIFIRLFGLLGASLGTLLGYAFIFFVRIPILKKRFPLETSVKNILLYAFINVIMIISCQCFKTNLYMLAVLSVIGVMVFLSSNKQLINKLLPKAKITL